jgi:hypothetical protein
MPRRKVTNEAARLRVAWHEAQALQQRHEGTFGSDEAEQKAFDALVEFVEQNNLNSTSYDPR